MNSFHNPLFLMRLVKSYLTDVNRLCRVTANELREYQDTAFRQIIQHADKIPLYHDKFKKHKVNLNEIHGIDDIQKLPIVTKEDLRAYYPHGIIADSYREKDGFLIHTSGSTGKPVFVFVDLFSAIRSLEIFVRTLRIYGGTWKTSRIAMIIDTSPGSFEHMIFTSKTFLFLKRFVRLSNIKYIDISDPLKDIIKELDHFQPEFIGSDPYMLRELACLVLDGKGKFSSPCLIFSSGAMLDQYSKNYIQDAFQTKVLDIYGTTEAGPVAYQCPNNDHYHVHSDSVYLEYMDDNNNIISVEKPGRILITKLYGQGTPIIRYSGIDDLVTPMFSSGKCNIPTQLLKQIEGRGTDFLILPDGSLLSPLSVTGIPGMTMQSFRTYKIKQFQIIQRAQDHIDVLIVIDNKLRTKGISVPELLNELEKRFVTQIGKDVRVTVREVESIPKGSSNDITKLVISELNVSQCF